MTDGIKKYLENLLLELNSNKELLYGYLNEINKPSLSEYLTVTDNPTFMTKEKRLDLEQRKRK